LKILTYRGGVGDHLLLSCVVKEFAKRGEEVSVVSYSPEIFFNSPDVTYVCFPGSRLHWHLRRKYGKIELNPCYLLNYDKIEDTRSPLHMHVLDFMCRYCGIEGSIEKRPWFYNLADVPTPSEYICLQTSGMGAKGPSSLKEWYPERFQQVADFLTDKIVQIGSKKDPLLNGVIDYRGVPIQITATLLKNAKLYIGLEGMLMHLARAVECKSLIIYGGRLKPWQIGYPENINIVEGCENEIYDTLGCWRAERCEYGRECMNKISVDRIKEALVEIL
jgi:hypothetical protein